MDNKDLGARPTDQALAVPATPASGRDASRFDPSRITTRQFGRSWWHAYDEKGTYIALGHTSRTAKKLALQKLSHGDVRGRADSMPDMSSGHLGAPASGMSAGTAETQNAAQGNARQPGPKETPANPLISQGTNP